MLAQVFLVVIAACGVAFLVHFEIMLLRELKQRVLIMSLTEPTFEQETKQSRNPWLSETFCARSKSLLQPPSVFRNFQSRTGISASTESETRERCETEPASPAGLVLRVVCHHGIDGARAGNHLQRPQR
jgi:hypothetical protein